MKLIIFDMDGVLVDSELFWEKLEKEYLNSVIVSWDDSVYKSITGLSVKDVYSFLSKRGGLIKPFEDFKKDYDRIAESIYRDKVSMLPGSQELIKELKSNKVQMALVSSSPRNWIDIVLERFDLADCFTAIVSSDDIKGKGKPSPEIYNLSSKKIKIDPTDCMVIEDSDNGVRSAKAAGMYCIGLKNGFNQEQDLSKANEVCLGFEEIKERVRELVA